LSLPNQPISLFNEDFANTKGMNDIWNLRPFAVLPGMGFSGKFDGIEDHLNPEENMPVLYVKKTNSFKMIKILKC
jgi:hypothetical protein